MPPCAPAPADAEAILRRFTRSNAAHPTYKAIAEIGKAVKTIFLCRYLGSEALRREIYDGLNVVECWSSTLDFLYYGKHDEITTNRLEDQELSVPCLHLLQVCLVYINTLMIREKRVQAQIRLTRCCLSIEPGCFGSILRSMIRL